MHKNARSLPKIDFSLCRGSKILKIRHKNFPPQRAVRVLMSAAGA